MNIKSDIPNHFLVFLISQTKRDDKRVAEIVIEQWNTNSETLQEFKKMLSLIDWEVVIKPQDTNAE